VRGRGSDIATIAAIVQRLAVLLAAGIPPVAAWGYLEEGEPSRRIAAECAAGATVPAAIVDAAATQPPFDLLAWRGLATAWAVATDVGSPLAPTLRDFAGSLRDLAQARREIAVAMAAPNATARLVLALPLVGLLFGMLLGFDTLGTLFTTPIGWVCLGLGGGLMLGASRWNRRLVRHAQPRDLTPGLAFDLLAIAVSGGGSLDRAQLVVAAAIEQFALDGSLGTDGTEEVLALSRRAGIPAAELLRSEAGERRRQARADVSERAQALSVRLMIPLGVCVLPAFMVLSVVPLLVTVLRGTSIAG
jgi:tight adherence protein B